MIERNDDFRRRKCGYEPPMFYIERIETERGFTVSVGVGLDDVGGSAGHWDSGIGLDDATSSEGTWD